MSGWADIVGSQIAAQQGADALRRAAQGEEFGDVGVEGPRVGHDGGRGRRMELDEGRPPRRALRSGRESEALTRQDREILQWFCEDAADLMAQMGARFTPKDVARILSRLSSEGWHIDVDRDRR